MVWGWIHSDGQRGLVRVEETMDSPIFCNLLNGHYFHRNNGQIMQQDGAPIHTSRYTKAYFQNHNIEILPDWPLNSPDLIIIENVWGEIKRKLPSHNISTINELWDGIQTEFYNMPNEFIENPYNSIDRRLNHVIFSKGNNIRY